MNNPHFRFENIRVIFAKWCEKFTGFCAGLAKVVQGCYFSGKILNFMEYFDACFSIGNLSASSYNHAIPYHNHAIPILE